MAFTTTSNYGLNLLSRSQDARFIDFRDRLMGTDTVGAMRSNMNIIDEALANINRQGIFIANAIGSPIPNSYIVTNERILSLYDGLIIIFVPNATNTGASMVSINSLSPVPIRKIDSNGDFQELELGDLLYNNRILLVYSQVGTCFVIVSGGAGGNVANTELVEITHNKNKIVNCILYSVENGAGLQGAGETGFGGENLFTTPSKFEFPSLNSVIVYSLSIFKNCTTVYQIDENTYSLVGDINSPNLILIIM